MMDMVSYIISKFAIINDFMLGACVYHSAHQALGRPNQLAGQW